MTVQELINKLNTFDPNLEVEITDGCEAVCYSTKNAEVKVFDYEDDSGKVVVDIGIGGNRL
jgi:hypothetical protein